MALTRPRAAQIYDIDYKQATRVVTVANITLGGGAPSSVDGVNLSLNDRVLVTGQSTASQNGLYYVTTVGTGSNGTWARSTDSNSTGELLGGTIVMVTEGTVYADTQWKLTTNDPIVIGSTALTFVQNYSANSISAGTSNVSVLSNSSVTISSAGTANVAKFDSTAVTFTANLLPTSNVTYSLGATAQRWKDIWLSNSTIYLGNVSLSADATQLTVNGSNVVTSTGGAISTAGNVSGGNVLTNGLISAIGNITGNYILGNGSQLTGIAISSISANSLTGTVLNSGVVTSSLTSVGTLSVLSVSGNITTGNISATNYTGTTVSVTGRVTAASVVGGVITGTSTSVSGTTTAASTVGGVITGTSTSVSGGVTAASVVGGVITGSSLSTTGTITGTAHNGTSVSVTGGVTAASVSGGVITGTSTSVTGTQTAASTVGGVITGTSTSVSGAITGGSLATGGTASATGNVTGGNVLTGGLISATGNITGNYILGNGSQLTGLPATYSNTNVSSFLAAFGSNTISTTGTITAGNITGGNLILSGAIQDSGQLDIQTTASNGNIVLTPNGTGNVNTGANISVTGRVSAASVSVSGAVTAASTVGGVITGSSSSVTGTQTAASTVGGVITGSSSSVSGGVTAASVAGGVITGTSTSVTGSQTAASTVGGVITGSSSSVTGTQTAASTVGGVITGSSTSVTGTTTAASVVGGVITGTSLSTSGNITGGNIVATTALTNGNITITGANIISTGPTLYIDPNGGGGTDGNVIITGNLSVQGNVTYINSNNITTNDLTINVANNAATAAAANGGGLGVGPAGSEYISLTYNSTSNVWVASNGLNVQGIVSASGNITGGNISATNHTGTNVSVTGTQTAASTVGGVITGTSVSVSGAVTGASVVGGVITGSSVSVSGAVTAASVVGGVITGTSTSVTGTTTAASVVGGVITGSSVSVTGAVTGASLAGTITTASQTNITGVGTIGTGTWQATDIALAYGGTNATLTAVNGGVVYSNASAMAITSAGTSGQALLSAGASAPVWTTLSLTDLPDAWVKKSVVAATTGNITLSAPQTIDGVAVVAGNRVLVKDQATASQNGIYVAAAGAWSRSTDADTITELAGACVNVDAGTVNGGFRFDTDLKTTDTLGTTAVTWYKVYDSGDAATAATASKLALRDANGNINATVLSATGNIYTGNILTNGYYYANGVAFTGGGGGGTPGGANTYIQFNDGGSFGGTAGLTFNKTTNAVATTGTFSATGNITGGNITTTGKLSAGTANITPASQGFGTGFNVTSGDITVFRGDSSGAIYVGNSQATYIYYDGTSWSIAGGTGVAVAGLTTIGTVSATGNITGGNLSTAGRITSTIATGTAPLVVSSTTKVSNLNVEQVDGFHADQASTANTIVVRDANGNINTTVLSASGNITGSNLILSGAITDSGQLDIQTTASNGNIVLTPNGTGNVNTGANISVTGRVTAASVVGGVITGSSVSVTGAVTGASLVGTITTASQTNITGVGNVTTGTWSATAVGLAYGGTGKTTAPAAMAALMGYTSTATAAGTTILTNTSSYYQQFTGTSTQTVRLPVTSTLQTGWTFHIVNNSTGNLTVQSSGTNTVITVIPGTTAMVTCIGIALTTAADWESGITDFSTYTGTGAVVLGTSPSLTTPALGAATGTSVSVTGAVTGASLVGTITTAAQTNITSVGTLSSLSVTANVQGGNLRTAGQVSATGAITGASVVGGVMTGSSLSVSGAVTAASTVGGVITGSSASLTGNVTGGNIITSGSGGNITGANVVSATTISTSQIINSGANGVGNIGSSTTYFNTAFVKATSAQYADLAEKYSADENYIPGTVVEFGGSTEVTISTESHSTRVAGIVSTNPSYLMNSALNCANAVEIALTGRVPCQVVGTIRKGDRLVASQLPGVATVLDMKHYEPGCIIGKALENYDSIATGVIEVAVGRF